MKKTKTTAKYKRKPLQPKTHPFIVFLLWLLGLLLILFGITLMLINLWAGFIWLLSGIVLLPVFFRQSNMSYQKRLIISPILVCAGLIFAVAQGNHSPESNNLSHKLDEILAENTSITIDENPTQITTTKKPQTTENKSASANRHNSSIKNTNNKQQINCKIIKVSDGDTATCLTSQNEQLRVRLSQIDAPEKAQAFGQASKRALSNLIHNQSVTLMIHNQDRYGRYVSEIYLHDQNINKQMVIIGMAWAYKEYLKDNEYLSLEQQARTKKLGLWADKKPIYPSDFRKSQRKQSEN